MRESRTYGSVRGALSNERPYRVLIKHLAVGVAALLTRRVAPKPRRKSTLRVTRDRVELAAFPAMSAMPPIATEMLID
jgi:hypothetical protein